MNAHQILTNTIEKIEGAYAPSTIRAYKANFERFIEFCESVQANSLPANSREIACYIAHLTNSKLRSASIRIAIAAISSIHRLNQFDDPTLHPDIKIEMKRMHRRIGRAGRQAYGITIPILEKMIKETTNDARGARDRALLRFAHSSLCRRSEIASLKIEDIIHNEFNSPSLIRLRKSKTDQEAVGKVIKIEGKTQSALKDWIRCGNITEGFIFRGVLNNGVITKGINAGQINRIYKKLAKKINLESELIQKISGHSFRVGGVQDLLQKGESIGVMMQKGRWSKIETLMRYLENFT